MSDSRRLPLFLQVSLAAATCLLLASCGAPEEHWWKGNLHTHSLWSDGDDYPEMIVDWYKRHDYDFVALSDHNVLAVGERWIEVMSSAGGTEALTSYLERFGDSWVEYFDDSLGMRVRLKTLQEYRGLFEEPKRFLILQSEEISDRFESKPVHVNVTNLAELIAPQGGGSVREVMQNNVDAVLEQRRRTGQAMFPHINHPNYGWAVMAEDIIALEGERFFEVYNGHPAVNNHGDELRPSTERMWDIILAERLSRNDEVMFGIAVDDAHNYHDIDAEHSNPGRGWVMVQAAALTADALVAAMERGEFYSSTGVRLRDVRVGDGAITIEIEPADGVTYTTEFIGTRRGYAPATPTAESVEGASVALRYSDDIGVVLAEVSGASATYGFRGEELYVRAKVISSKVKANAYMPGEVEVAWTQPIVRPPAVIHSRPTLSRYRP